SWPVAGSHSRSMWSLPTEARSLPSGEKATLMTEEPAWRRRGPPMRAMAPRGSVLSGGVSAARAGQARTGANRTGERVWEQGERNIDEHLPAAERGAALFPP